MTKNKLLIFISITLIFVFFAFIYFRNQEHVVENTGSESTQKQNDLNTEPVKLIEVKIIVQDKTYNQSVEQNITVEEILTKLANENKDFKIVFKDYGFMGKFVESINGLSGTNKKSWIYSVNGIEASVGISKYVVKNGDIISWEYEDVY